MKLSGIVMEVTPAGWRWGFIDEDDAFHEVLNVGSKTAFPPEFSDMPLNEAIGKGIAWIAQGPEGISDGAIDELIRVISQFRSRPFPTV